MGAPAGTAAEQNNYSRALNGASYSAREFVQLLGEQNIQLAPTGAANFRPRPVDPRRGFVFGAEPSPEPQTPPVPASSRLSVCDDESLPPSSPPHSSPTPQLRSLAPPPLPAALPRPIFTPPPPAPRMQGYTTTAGLAVPSRPRLPTLPGRPLVFSLPSPPPARPEANPSPKQCPKQQPLYRVDPVHPNTFTRPGSPTNSDGSTSTASPSPEPEPEPAPAPRRGLQRERAYAQLNTGLQTSPEVPRLRPATFTPPRRPLRREPHFRISPPARVAPAPAVAQEQEGPSRQPTQAQAGLPTRPTQRQAGLSRRPAQVQPGPSKQPAANAGPSRLPARAPMAGPTSRPLQGQTQAAEPRHRVAAPFRVRDPSDGRFYLPMLPADASRNKVPEPGKYLVNTRHMTRHLHVQR